MLFRSWPAALWRAVVSDRFHHKKVLTENLRELEDLGIITRTAHQGNTLKVVYRLTERGAQLQPIFNELILWSLRYSEERRSELLLFTQQPAEEIEA